MVPCHRFAFIRDFMAEITSCRVIACLSVEVILQIADRTFDIFHSYYRRSPANATSSFYVFPSIFPTKYLEIQRLSRDRMKVKEIEILIRFQYLPGSSVQSCARNIEQTKDCMLLQEAGKITLQTERSSVNSLKSHTRHCSVVSK